METNLIKKMVIILDTRLKIIKIINRFNNIRLSLIIYITRFYFKKYFRYCIQSPIFVGCQRRCSANLIYYIYLLFIYNFIFNVLIKILKKLFIKKILNDFWNSSRCNNKTYNIEIKEADKRS